MQQRVQMIAYDGKHCHVVLIVRLIVVSIAGTPPFFVERWCQSELKRTLRQAADRRLHWLDAEIRMYRQVHSAEMVNAKFPEPSVMVSKSWMPLHRRQPPLTPRSKRIASINRKFTANRMIRILGKLDAAQIPEIYSYLIRQTMIANPIATGWSARRGGALC